MYDYKSFNSTLANTANKNNHLFIGRLSHNHNSGLNSAMTSHHATPPPPCTMSSSTTTKAYFIAFAIILPFSMYGIFLRVSSRTALLLGCLLILWF